MGNILRYWNQNRKRIIIGLVAIASIIFIIQILNNIAKQQKEIRVNKVELTEYEQNLPTESIIGGKTVSLNTTKSNVGIIEEFVQKCNNGDVTGAYNMLTDYCKEAIYPTEENFRESYYKIYFASKKVMNIENFLSGSGRYTYLVKLYDDVLSSGTMENAKVFQDYITIDSKSESGKINLGSLIYKQNINKTIQKDGIAITIISKEIYKENEKYQIKIQNNTDKKILIDTKTKSKSIYLLGDNNVMYSSNIQEIATTLYQIPERMYKNYELKFNKIYSSGVEAKEIVFSDIVPDYEKYKQSPNETNERVKISIKL